MHLAKLRVHRVFLLLLLNNFLVNETSYVCAGFWITTIIIKYVLVKYDLIIHKVDGLALIMPFLTNIQMANLQQVYSKGVENISKNVHTNAWNNFYSLKVINKSVDI